MTATREIRLTRGYVAIVDEADFAALDQYTWYAHIRIRRDGTRRVYAARTIGEWPNQRQVLMHRQILAAPHGTQIDHRDRDGLNNTRLNLRFCTGSQNSSNREIVRSKCGFKGVRPKRKRWSAVVIVRRRQYQKGTFATAAEAAKAYDQLVTRLYGEFAVTNASLGLI